MTVSSQTSRVAYPGDGVTAIFPVPFYFLENTHLKVILSEDATGIETILVLNTDYTVTGAGVLSGGSITVPNEPAVGFKLTILRSVPITQETDYVANDPFPAESHERALDKLTMILQQLSTDSAGAIKVAVSDPEPSRLPPAASRALRLMGFDSLGNPVAVTATADSAAALALDLLNASDPARGAGQVGFGESVSYASGTTGYAIQHSGHARTIESFGPTDTPANTKATMQTAINYCAANGFKLIAGASEYTVDLSTTSITIPDNFRCDLGNALIKRETGNATPQDMWINADTVGGNTGLDIRNVRFDGQRQADSLTNATVAHRFCGLRLIKCTGYIENVRVDNTVNAEVQVEGTRAAIMLSASVLMICKRLFADGTAGTGFIAEDGLVSVDGAWFYNNTGSGGSVRNCDGSYFNNMNNDTSGYSGLSFNAGKLRISNMYSKNTPVGYAGINIGHSSAASQSPDCVAVNLLVEACLGWGIFVNYADRLLGSNWSVLDAVTRNIHIVDSLKVRISNLRSRNAATGDLLVTGASSAWLDVDFQGSQSSSAQATGTATVEFSSNSIISDACQAAAGTIGAIVANAGTTVVYKGNVENSDRYGAISTGASARLELRGAKITGSAIGPTLASAGGVITYEGVKLSETDQTSGTFTIAAAASTATVTNGNSIDINRILITPTNAEARLGAVPRITAVTPGVSFAVSIDSATTNDRTYSYVLL